MDVEFFKKCLIGRKFLYSVLVSAVQQRESVIYISLPSLPSSHPTPLGHHGVPGWAPHVIYNFPLFYTWLCIYFNAPFLNLSHLHLPPLCAQVRSLPGSSVLFF